MYLNSHTWFRILTIKSLIFRQIFFPWNVSVNFRLNKLPLPNKNIRLFWELFVSSYKESSYEGSKISPFPNLCSIYLNKVILRIPQIQIFWNSWRSSYRWSAYKNSKFVLHSLYFLEIFRNHPKMFAIFEFIRQFL